MLTAKGKGSIKPVSPRKRFFTMLCNHYLPVDEAEQDARQRQKALNKRGQHVLPLIFQAMSDKTIDKNQHDQLIMKILQQQSDSKITVWPDLTMSLSIFAVRQAALRADILMLNRLLRKIPLLIDALKKIGKHRRCSDYWSPLLIIYRQSSDTFWKWKIVMVNRCLIRPSPQCETLLWCWQQGAVNTTLWKFCWMTPRLSVVSIITKFTRG